MINIDKEKCTGCNACLEICPKLAIKMIIEEGFRYPQIDIDKCVECHLCEKVCPALNRTINNNIEKPMVYAAWSKNEEIRSKCTSGGMCYELSRYVMSVGGYVAGVVWSEGYKNAQYIITNSMEDLDKLMQTKYFQPKMNGIYEKVKEKLDLGCLVLFIGSACCNDALKRFLSQSYEKLYCLDYICRGYTSQIFHEKRIDYLEEKHKSRIKFVQYKNKKMGWTKFGTLFSFENGDEEYINRLDDPYELMFKVEDNNTRPSCYDCKYRSIPRHTDITVGDFWGIQDVDSEDLKLGISAVLISSPKGRKLFGYIENEIFFELHDVDEVSRGNKALLNQLTSSSNRKKFFEELETCPFSMVIKKYASKNIIRKKIIKNIIKNILKCNLTDFIHLNFFCSNITRKRWKFIFPIRGSKVDIEKNSKLILNDNLYLNFPKHKNSKEECYLKILSGGCFEVNGNCRFAANNTIEINHNAKLTVGKIEANYGTVIVCGNQISIGDDVGFGRNVTIYDNNFHSTGLNKKIKLKPLIIEDHVWLCTGVTIAKGVKIGYGAVCSINSTVTRNVKSKNMVSGNPAKVIMTNVEW